MGLRLATGPAVWVLAAAGTASWGLLYYSFGVLLGPMAEALDVSEAQISGAFSVALLAAAAAAPAAGRAADRVGAGPVMAVGSGLGALGFALASVAGSAGWLYASWALLGVAHVCTSYEPAFAAVTAWFPDARARRRALLVVTSLGGLASPLFVPFVAFVVGAVGFRPGALVFAAVLLLVVTPLHAALCAVRHSAVPLSAVPLSAVPLSAVPLSAVPLSAVPLSAMPLPPPARGATAGRAAVRSSVRDPSLPPRAATVGHAATAGSPLLLATVLAIHAFASTGLAAFVFPVLVERGVAPGEAAALAGLVGAAQVPARLLYPLLCSRVSSRARLAVLLAVQAVALAGVGVLSGPALALGLVAFGAANGLVTLERAWVVAEWFGVDGYAARSGTLAAGSMLARAAAPVTIALIATEASYTWAFGILACGLAGAVLMQGVGERWRGADRPAPESAAAKVANETRKGLRGH